MATALADAGITDSYLIPSGENRNALSLGVFSSLAAAQRRTIRINALGISNTAQLRTQTIQLPVTRNYLVVAVPGRDNAGELAVQMALPSASVRGVACPQP